MDNQVVQRVFEGGRDCFPQSSPPSSTSSSILQSLPLHVSFNEGYFLLVKAVQELRDKKVGLVTVGIGGPSGSGKTSLAEKAASVFGSTIVLMENYRNGVDDENDFESIDFDTLVQNLEDLIEGKDAVTPLFDFHEKKRVGWKTIKSSSSRVVIVDGTYALHSRLRSLVDIRVAVVGGVHFSLLSKVGHDIGDSCSLDYLIDSIFPLFRKHIEPDLHHAQIRINNCFGSSFREPIYKLKCRHESPYGHSAYSFNENEARTDNFIEMYLRPPSAREEARINDWIKVRQSGIRYYVSLGDQRIVDRNYIIRPKTEFEVGRMTLGGLLDLGYTVVVSYKRVSSSVTNEGLSLSLETIDTLGETFMVLRGADRKELGAEASRMRIQGPWITKSYLETILETRGVPRPNTPPPLWTCASPIGGEEKFLAPRPIRVASTSGNKFEDLSQAWTRSPTKFKMDPVLATWRFRRFIPSVPQATDSFSFSDTMQLAPIPDSYDFDRGLLLAVQAIQTLVENKGHPVIVGIGGPSGSGKTSLAQQVANIVGCEVISLEAYDKFQPVKKDVKNDDFSSLDLPLLLKNIADIRNSRRTEVPIVDLENCTRTGFKEVQVSDDCGVVIIEGVYALHPDICKSLDLSVAVVGGVHSHLIARVQRDKSRIGCFLSQDEITSTIFPMFQEHIEPHLVHAHVKIRNDFDPVLSAESSLFVLKSNTQVEPLDILKALDPDPEKLCSSDQNFTDIYLRLPGAPSNGRLAESECIRVRMCEGKFALLIREPLIEGSFVIQPKVDFDISINTVAGLFNLGYQAVAYIEASALIYQDDKILMEVDHLQDSLNPYIQIKGTNREVVAAAGSALGLDGSYTTKSYLQIVLDSLPSVERSSTLIHSRQATRLQELVELIQSQGTSSVAESSPVSEGLVVEVLLDDLQLRIRKLERLQTINTVLWTFLMSVLVGYSLHQRKRR